jgi:hypothetical protein
MQRGARSRDEREGEKEANGTANQATGVRAQLSGVEKEEENKKAAILDKVSQISP